LFGVASPVRLKVSYKTPEALLSEYTRSIGRGGVSIASRKSVPVGTRFIFELKAKGVTQPVEVHGEVVAISQADTGLHLLQVKYDPVPERAGLEAVLQKIFDAHQYEKVRKHPRIPLQLKVVESKLDSTLFQLKDVSRGGMGFEIESPQIPRGVSVGNAFLLELGFEGGALVLHGEIVWVAQGAVLPPQGKKMARLRNPSFGVQFGKLQPRTLDKLDKILALRGLPSPPWSGRVSFGMDAVARMP
jgi:hypothetical protein